MKNLLIIFLATSISVNTVHAQNSINFNKPDRIQHKHSLRFIEGIEINPEQNSGTSEPAITQLLPAAVKSVSAGPIAALKSIESCIPIQFKYAMILNSEVESITNISLFLFIDDWWGTHYRLGGSTRKGIDCSSFSAKLYEEIYHIVLPRTAREQFHFTEPITGEALSQGDLVFFNTRGGISHVGVYLGNNYFVHSSCHSGVTISSLDDPYYSRTFLGARRTSSNSSAGVVSE